MYLEYWGLTQPPFNEAHNPAMFVPSAQYQLLKAKVEYLVGQGQGAAALCGEAGVGKSACAWELLREFSRQGFATSYIVTPIGGPAKILASIAHDLGGEGENPIDAIVSALERIKDENRHACVVIDEVHTIADISMLESLRLLLNVEIHGSLPLTLLLVGQPPMRRMLRKASSFDQRLSFLIELSRLDDEETKNYVLARLKAAGCKRGLFTKTTAELICEKSGGIPRQVNRICDLALLTGCGLQQDKIRPEIVTEVIDSLNFCNEPDEDIPAPALALSVPAPNAAEPEKPDSGESAPATDAADLHPNEQSAEMASDTITASSDVAAEATPAPWDIMASMMQDGPDATTEDILSSIAKTPAKGGDILAGLQPATDTDADDAEPDTDAAGLDVMNDVADGTGENGADGLAEACVGEVADVERGAAEVLSASAVAMPEPVMPRADQSSAPAAPSVSHSKVAPAVAPIPASPKRSESMPSPRADLFEDESDHALPAAEDAYSEDTIAPEAAYPENEQPTSINGPSMTPSVDVMSEHNPLFDQDAETEFDPDIMTPPEADIITAPASSASQREVSDYADTSGDDDSSDDILTKALFGGLDQDMDDLSDQDSEDGLANIFGSAEPSRAAGTNDGRTASDDDIDDVLKELGL